MSEQQQAQEDQKSIAEAGLIGINSLQYRLPPDLSVVISRTNTSNFFQQDAYTPGSTAVCILNTGSAYVWGPGTYLTFTFQNLTTNQAGDTGSSVTFGVGSAVNVIRRITIYSRSGDVLERIQNVNALSQILGRYQHSDSWVGSVGANMGYNTGSIAGQARTRYVIPMSEISGLFRYESLLPAALCSGLRIELELAPSVEALKAAAATDIPGYAISDIHVQCDSYQLTDLVQRQLNQMASTSGLEVVYSTFFDTQSSRATSTLNLESRKAVSRALGAVFKERAPKAATGAANVDAFAATTIDSNTGPTDVQFRLGSLYFPNSALRQTSPLLNTAETYQMAMRFLSNKKQSPHGGCSVSPADFVATENVLAVDLERSSTLQLSGVPISNSRCLALNAAFRDTPATATLIDFWLNYVTLARVFLSNSVIEV